ncbi:hypothetical protein PC110_g21532, partial [Phytophthora cactorum]
SETLGPTICALASSTWARKWHMAAFTRMYEVRYPGSWLKYRVEMAESGGYTGGERAEKSLLRIGVKPRKRRGGRTKVQNAQFGSGTVVLNGAWSGEGRKG